MKKSNLAIAPLIENNNMNGCMQRALPHISLQVPKQFANRSIVEKLLSKAKASAQDRKNLRELKSLSPEIKKDIGLSDAELHRMSAKCNLRTTIKRIFL